MLGWNLCCVDVGGASARLSNSKRKGVRQGGGQRRRARGMQDDMADAQILPRALEGADLGASPDSAVASTAAIAVSLIDRRVGRHLVCWSHLLGHVVDPLAKGLLCSLRMATM